MNEILDVTVSNMERYMTLAWQSGAIPIIVLTKADLEENYDEYVRKIELIAPEVKVHPVSSKTGYGMEKIEKYLQPEKLHS